MSRKLPVPRGFALPVEAFRHFLDQADLLDDARALRRGVNLEGARLLREAIVAAPLPGDLAGEIRAASSCLGLVLAVRSSAVDEDGSEQSFAGQYETVLGVSVGDQLEEAVRKCWASWYGDRALAYRRSSLWRAPLAGMGVVVQELVTARSSGVMFTINPLTGSWREMVVEAVAGQCDALVSGRIAADRYILRRPRRTPRPVQRVLARLSVDEVSADINHQRRKLDVNESGQLVWVDVDEGEKRKLSVDQLCRLGRMGLRAEGLAGNPQDLEWAITPMGEIRILQARAITAAGEPPRNQDVLWTRRFAGERWIEPVSPMGWSLVAPILEWFVAYPKTGSRFLGDAPAMRLVRGRPFFNVTVFRHLVFKLPGAPPPRFLLEFFPPEEERYWLRRHAAPPDFRVLASILLETAQERRWQRFRWNPFTNPKAWDELVEELNRELPRIRDAQGDAFSQVEHGVELIRAYVKVHVISLLYANLLYQFAGSRLPSDLRESLLLNPTASPTRQVNEALIGLAQGGAMDEFLEKYGHRSSSSSWDVFASRWAENPQRVQELAQSLSAGSLSRRNELEQAREVEQALVALRTRVKGVQRLGLESLLGLLHRYLNLREVQRFEFDRLLFAVKQAVERAAEEVLPGGGQACARWLQWPELLALREGLLDETKAVEIATRRRLRWERYAKEKPPPVFLEADDGAESRRGASCLEGLGISSGRVTGPARVLHSPEEGQRLAPGDILVAPATDPGWTSLFLRAGGVVMELGSMLSHGAVVAREYRLPAVVNVIGATETIEEGQVITVDGTQGRVWLHDEQSPSVGVPG